MSGRTRKAADDVAHHLRMQVADGTLRSGDLLPSEADLMTQLGVSRPTLREALRLLESEGLVTVRRGNVGGVRIEGPDRAALARYTSLHLAMAGASLADVYEARDVLELEAVRTLAADRRASRNGLEAALEGELACGDDVDAYGPAHDRFHVELMKASGNPVLDLLWHTLDEVVDRHRARFVSSRRGRAELAEVNVRSMHQGRRAHEELLGLLAARRVDEAERVWARHLESARGLLLTDAAAITVDLLD